MKTKTRIRQIVVLVLLVTGFISFITGTILLLSSEGYKGETLIFSITRRNLKDYHTYASFIASGAAFIHAIINWPAIKYYIKNLLKIG